MNRTSFFIVTAGIVLLFFSVLFPPWVVYTKGVGGTTELPYGYTFLFTTPTPSSPNISIRVDFTALFLEWVVLFAGVGFGLWLERKKKAAAPSSSSEE